MIGESDSRTISPSTAQRKVNECVLTYFCWKPHSFMLKIGNSSVLPGKALEACGWLSSFMASA